MRTRHEHPNQKGRRCLTQAYTSVLGSAGTPVRTTFMICARPYSVPAFPINPVRLLRTSAPVRNEPFEELDCPIHSHKVKDGNRKQSKPRIARFFPSCEQY